VTYGDSVGKEQISDLDTAMNTISVAQSQADLFINKELNPFLLSNKLKALFTYF